MTSPMAVFLRLVLALGLALSAGGTAWALSLGSLQGKATFGRELDVRAPFVLENKGEALAPCLHADVFYGGRRIDPALVRTDVQIIGLRGTFRVRVTGAVDAATVTVSLQTRCSPLLARDVMLFTENAPERLAVRDEPPAAEPVAAVAVTAAPAEVVAAQPMPAARRASTAAPAPPPPAAAAAQPQPRAVTSAPAPGQVRPARDQPAAAAAPAAPALRPVPVAALANEPQPRLRLSPWPGPMGEADGPRRAQARALWKVLQAEPADLVGQARLAGDLAERLRASDAARLRTEGEVAALRVRGTPSEGKREWWLLSGVLLAALLAGAALILYRRRPSRDEPSRDTQPPRAPALPATAQDLDEALDMFLDLNSKGSNPRTSGRKTKKGREA